MSCVAGVRSRKDGHSRVEGEELTLSERQNVLLSCKTLTERAAQAQISPTKPYLTFLVVHLVYAKLSPTFSEILSSLLGIHLRKV
uniref:Uncharacterized protein n=1 Tax=Moniliophthora roreri TaxID=221103 RepID=A0A0W0G9T3_MONRR